jgi:hypothetical protein
MPAEVSIFEKIAQLGANAGPMGVSLRRWQPSVADCVLWLREAGLARDGHSLQPDPARDPAGLLDIGNPQVLGIPTYLVGDSRALARFAELVPAPNETYTSLFWLGDTATVDEYLKDRKKKEAAAKKLS